MLIGCVACPFEVTMELRRLSYLWIGAALNVGCSVPASEDGLLPSSSGEDVDAEQAIDAGVRGHDAAALDAAEAPSSTSAVDVASNVAPSDAGATSAPSLETSTPLETSLTGSTSAPTAGTSDMSHRTGHDAPISASSAPETAPESRPVTGASGWSDVKDGGSDSDAALATPDAAPDVGDVTGDALNSTTDTSVFDPAPSVSATDAQVGSGGLDAGVSGLFTGDGAVPTLTALQIVGAHTALFPEFDPARTRYSVIAEASDAVVGVIASAAGGAAVRVNGVGVVSGEQLDLSDVEPGSELVIRVGDGPAAATYVVQYLPTNFPELHIENPNPGATDEPLYLNLAFEDGEFIAKLDAAGVPLFYKQSSSKVYDFKKHPNGTYSYTVRRSNTRDGAYRVLLDAEFQETARLTSVGLVNTDVHDFLILDNGNHVFMAYEPAVHDLSGFGLSATQKVVDSVFQEVSPERQVLFQWNSFDHVQYDHSVYAFELQEYAHANSIALDHDGQWLLSLRGLSQVLKLDRTTGEVIWRLGGVASDFTFIGDPYNGFCGQHTASRLDNGHILLFDNSRECLPELAAERPLRSRILEYALDEVNMTAELVWSYEREGFVAYSQGSAERKSNGNTMIGWGNGPAAIATEVNADGEVVYELTAQARNGALVSCYRARKFAD